MNNSREIKILKRKNGFVVQFKKWNVHFYLYVLRRLLQFVFDYVFCFLILYVLAVIFQVNLYSSVFISMVASWFYNGWSIYLGKNKTFGMWISQLCIVRFDGSEFRSFSNYIPRIVFQSLYLIPIFGWCLVLISFFTSWVTKGVSLVDWVTRTQVFSKDKALFFKKVYKLMNEGSFSNIAKRK